ncbi:hypothetical protein GN316_09400 [Xylophilus sp. Kf1]|nr:hypothetical protein [Xylophilus sp. Kf1]
MSPPVAHALHWDNISALVLDKQRTVFAALGLPLRQDHVHKMRHGLWMNQRIAEAGHDDIVVFCDVDAFPMRRPAWEQAMRVASQGAIFGLAQFSNHRPTPEVYAGPMFMAFRKSVWSALGCPDMRSCSGYDAGEALSLEARRQGVALHLVKPTACVIPKYALGHEGIFGIGTFYGENDFFHLFESRDAAHEKILVAVADDVSAHRPLDFANYLALGTDPLKNPAEARRRNRLGWWRRIIS